MISIGPGVSSSWLGRRVVAGPGTHGAYAELVRTGVDRLIPVPDGLDLRDAAASPRSTNVLPKPVASGCAASPTSSSRRQFKAPEMVRLAEKAVAAPLRPVIAHEYPLAAAADAHRAIEAREMAGKALLIPSGS